jgi:hypothetical protein
MLKIDPQFILKVQQSKSLVELYPLFQKAIELEHSTIPPYLTAMYSLKPSPHITVQPPTNKGPKEIIHSIVVEEMLHMTIAANILNALGGSPKINKQNFVPEYPGHLPMGIGGSLVVGLEKYSKDVVKNVFMEIEEPENPIVFKSATMAAVETFKTIGQFYQALQQKIIELAPDQLPGNPAKQVTSRFFSSTELYPILTKQNALDAINIIIEQGEGTTISPLDPEGEIAHYYRFEELYKGKKLVKNSSAPNGFSFTGADIPFVAADVYNLFPNTKTAMLPAGTEARRRMDAFNTSYYSLLAGLHRTFNGEPKHLDDCLGLMYDIKLYAEKLCGMDFPGKTGYNVGPSFEYVDTVAFLNS